MSMVNLNFWRQLDVFTPDKFERDIHVVGCGAIGSNFIETMIRSGIGGMHVYDFDLVDTHNIPNQAFWPDQIGKPKVEAMAEIATRLNTKIIPYNEKISKLKITKQSYVIMAVDSMEARKAIWDSSVRFNPNVRLIEARMAAEYGIIHCINPLNIAEIKYWEGEWRPDSEIPESACTNRAVATTARSMAAQMVHNLIEWETGNKPPTHIIKSLRPAMIESAYV